MDPRKVGCLRVQQSGQLENAVSDDAHPRIESDSDSLPRLPPRVPASKPQPQAPFTPPPVTYEQLIREVEPDRRRKRKKRR